MATVSNPATLSSVKTVFGGGTPPNNLRSYLKGGSYVPNLAYYSGIPTSGTLNLSSFAGLVYPTLQFTGAGGMSGGVSGGGPLVSASVDIYMRSNGQVQVYEYSSTSGTNLTTNYAWLLAGSAGDYECYMLKSGGDTPGTVNTWLNLGTTRNWSLGGSGGFFSSSFTGTLYIRGTAPTANLVSGGCSITVEIEV